MPTDDANPWDDPDAGPADAPAATPAEPATPAAPTPGAAPDAGAEGEADRRRVLVIAAVAIVVIAAVAFVLTRGGDEGDDAATPTTAGQGQATDGGGGPGGGAIVIAGTSDTFNREDSDDGLGALPSGAPWIIQSGTWAIRSGEAVVAQPEAERRNTAIVATGYPDPQAQVRMTKAANGAGMVFRYQGECNFWAVYAVPEYATWNVEKVIDCARVGEEEDSPVYRTIASAPVGDGTTVGVVLNGDQVQIVLNGNIALTFEDPDLAGVGRLGLTTRGDGDAAFDDFVAGGPGGQGVVGPSTEGGAGGSTTTTAAEDGGGGG